MQNFRLIIAPLLLSIGACSGGGSSAPAPPPANQPPSFTSAAAANVVENTALAYQATASDPEGQTLSFSLNGGADVALFDVNVAGQVSFKQPPSFETARDANGDNVYEVTVAVSDGSNSRSQAVSVAVTNSREGIAATRSTIVFDNPVAASATDDGDNVLIAQQDGKVWLYNPVTDSRTLLCSFVSSDPSWRLAAVAAIGSFPQQRLIYVATTTNSRISLHQIPCDRFDYSFGPTFTGYDDLLYSDVSHRTVALAVDYASNPLIIYGDAGGTNDPSGSAQSNATFHGKLVRIYRDRFARDPVTGLPVNFVYRAEARGIQNPRGIFVLPFNGNIYFADRGSRFGEINVIQDTFATPTINFGWPFREGTTDISSAIPSDLRAPSLLLPVGSGRNEGGLIVGGAPFPGTGTNLAGRYVFGDSLGNIFTVPIASLTTTSTVTASGFERRNEDFAVTGGSIGPIAAIVASGTSGMVIIADNGAVYRVTASAS